MTDQLDLVALHGHFQTPYHPLFSSSLSSRAHTERSSSFIRLWLPSTAHYMHASCNQKPEKLLLINISCPKKPLDNLMHGIWYPSSPILHSQAPFPVENGVKNSTAICLSQFFKHFQAQRPKMNQRKSPNNLYSARNSELATQSYKTTLNIPTETKKIISISRLKIPNDQIFFFSHFIRLLFLNGEREREVGIQIFNQYPSP